MTRLSIFFLLGTLNFFGEFELKEDFCPNFHCRFPVFRRLLIHHKTLVVQQVGLQGHLQLFQRQSLRDHLLRQSLLLRLYYCVCWMDPGKEGLFRLARDDSQIIGWMDGFYYRGFDS